MAAQISNSARFLDHINEIDRWIWHAKNHFKDGNQVMVIAALLNASEALDKAQAVFGKLGRDQPCTS